MQLSPVPCYSTLPVPNIFVSVLFLNNLNLCHLKLRDQVLHPYKTMGKITVPYILIFQFLDGTWKNDSELNGSKHSPNATCF
jgi:hypothetical protein